MCEIYSHDHKQITMEYREIIVGYEVNKFPQSLMSPFYSEYIGVIVCHQGMFRFCVNGVSQVTSADETVFLSKGIMFNIMDTSDDVRVTMLFYRTEQIKDMLGNTVISMRLYSTIYPSAFHVMHTGYEEALSDYARMISRTVSYNEENIYISNEHKLLLMAITYRLCSIFSASVKATGKEMDRKIEIFETLIKLIDENFTRQRNVSFYADRLCLTPKYLTVLVKSLCGKTVQQLLFKAIIRRSIFLMKTTNKTIQQIAYELSFPNASAFGTFFKKHTGLSPKHYRMGAE